ncbi:T9SS type A sorting domain-containing protein [Hymenobacter caeli]|uniref:Secretion system C-terminal sorting domain-containing protein n=1 Tax=Hymenobacter caeli TaxID=2735894 RepID=A0ABX2FVA5_9BACT|nr:T9SS type A sorting domain-containing protein [Hymenobacter caeli]NRT21074.1 hypothetical protein [Hymenobacter caeli]
MKNLFSLLTAGTLALGALSAQAQFTVDGVLSSTEIGTGVGKYQLAGSYTGTHLEADRGLQALYVGYTATTLNIMVVGVGESASGNYRALILYLNTAGRTGTAKGTKLIGGNDGPSPLVHKPTLDMEVDYGFRASIGATSNTASDVYFSRVSYVTGTTIAPGTDSYIGQGSKAGAQVVAGSSTADLAGSKFAYKNAGTITTNTANNGFEVEIPLTMLGTATSPVTVGSTIDLFAAFTDGGGVFTSADIIPQVAGRTTAFGADPDFTLIPGTQAVSFVLGTGALASRAGVATGLGFGVYPNPAEQAAATAAYLVPSGRQDVALSVYNTMGQLVRSVARGPQVGPQQVSLGALPAGAYLVRLQVGDQATSRTLLVH